MGLKMKGIKRILTVAMIVATVGLNHTIYGACNAPDGTSYTITIEESGSEVTAETIDATLGKSRILSINVSGGKETPIYFWSFINESGVTTTSDKQYFNISSLGVGVYELLAGVEFTDGNTYASSSGNYNADCLVEKTINITTQSVDFTTFAPDGNTGTIITDTIENEGFEMVAKAYKMVAPLNWTFTASHGGLSHSETSSGMTEDVDWFLSTIMVPDGQIDLDVTVFVTVEDSSPTPITASTTHGLTIHREYEVNNKKQVIDSYTPIVHITGPIKNNAQTATAMSYSESVGQEKSYTNSISISLAIVLIKDLVESVFGFQHGETVSSSNATSLNTSPVVPPLNFITFFRRANKLKYTAEITKWTKLGKRSKVGTTFGYKYDFVPGYVIKANNDYPSMSEQTGAFE